MVRVVLGGVVILLSNCALAFCFNEAAARYGTDVELLKAIARHESRLNPRAINVNPDGSRDIGVMQINTSWLDWYRRRGTPIAESDLLEPCFNVMVGAWVLATNIAQYGQTWNAVGAYNAKTLAKREIYIGKIWRELMRGRRGGPALAATQVRAAPAKLVIREGG